MSRQQFSPDSDRCSLITLAFIIGIAFLINLWFIAQDNLPPSWDYAYYLSRSLEFYETVHRGSFSEFFSILNDPYRPPLVALTTLPFYAFFGTSYRSAMMVNLVFIAVLIVSTYKLGKILHSPNLGLVAAGIISTLVGVVAHARIFGLDLPMTALVPAGLYLVIASEGFKKRNISILLGIIVALGLLIKWTYLIFVIPMILREIFRHRKNINYQNMIFSGLICITLSSTWYLKALEQGLIRKLFIYAWGPESIPFARGESMFDLSALLFYPKTLCTHLLGLFYAISLLSIIILIPLKGQCKYLRCSDRYLTKSLIFSFLVPLLIFSFVNVKEVRFLLPALPSLIILLVYFGWTISLRQISLGPFLLVGVVLSGSFISIAGTMQFNIGLRFGIYESYGLPDMTYGSSGPYSLPQSSDWKLERILETIAELNSQAEIGMLTCHWVFNQDTFRYYALRLGFDSLRFKDFRDSQISAPHVNLTTYDFILIKTGDIGPTWLTTNARNILGQLRNPQGPFYGNFRLIQRYELPDGSQVSIFMRKAPNA